MHRSVVVVFVVFALLGHGCTGVTLASSAAVDGAVTPSSQDAAGFESLSGAPSVDPPHISSTGVQSAAEFDTTTFEITVHEDGSATWTFRHERHLESQDDREEFRTFADRFEDEELPLYERFVGQAEALTETGTELTDREMDAESFNRSAEVKTNRLNVVGTVEMSFTWTNFARVDEETGVVRVGGDVFDGNLYISDDQTLTVVPADGLVFERTEPEGDFAGLELRDAPSVSWEGEREFGDGRPIAILEPEAGQSSREEGAATLSAADSRWLVVGGLLVVFALGAAAAIAWYRLRPIDGAPSPLERAVDSSSTDGGSQVEPASSGDPADQEQVGEPTPIPDEELLTDEDRVVELIRKNGGRMKQVHIVEETGWSKSKVSMLLSDMEDEETISKLRVGRENIISLEGFEPEATKSPFEE